MQGKLKDWNLPMPLDKKDKYFSFQYQLIQLMYSESLADL